jgi:glucosamine-6-phosphate deaminase
MVMGSQRPVFFMNEMPSAATGHAPVEVAGARPPCRIFGQSSDLAIHAARLVAQVIRDRNALGLRAVLGLPAGSSPVAVYRELIRMHRAEGLDFSQVETFNLDEYFGLSAERLQSFRRWMNDHFLRHVNIDPNRTHFLDGTIDLDQVEEHCRQFESAIESAGGIDVLLLGIGGNGHVGFNEPHSTRTSRTRLCALDPQTRRAAASDFFGLDHVPSHALTMGLGTILEARKILLLAVGEHKAAIVRQTIEGSTQERVPASWLKEHADATMLVDASAARELTIRQTPWLVQRVAWDKPLIKQAVLWLAQQTGKALLKIDDEDFRQHGLHDLLREFGPAHRICSRTFRWMVDTIEYHPAGKDTPKRIICFSPHPDDDVISMGGTLIRLNEDGHHVHIAYMTSGNIAVFDHDAIRIAELVAEYNRLFDIDQQQSLRVRSTVRQTLASKLPGDPDSEDVRRIKTLIRWSEAIAGATKVGCEAEHCHFLDLPFYRTGTVEKLPWDRRDVGLVRRLLESIQPEQIYVAGDWTDPHGTHRVCAEIIFAALDGMRKDDVPIPEVRLYRGAWQEYALAEIEVAVPLSPGDLERKRKAIFMHESQKDEALFPGADPREFWQRAQDRNQNTAQQFNAIGLPEYFAVEAFVRWDGKPI